MISRTKALRLLRKKLGRTVTMSEDKGAISPEERADRLRRIKEMEASPPQPPPEVLAYRQLEAEHRQKVKDLRSHLWRRRWNASVQSGYLPGLGPIRRAFGGDTLEELLRHAEIELTEEA